MNEAFNELIDIVYVLTVTEENQNISKTIFWLRRTE